MPVVSGKGNEMIYILLRLILIFCDLCDQDLTLKHGWRTGAIIPELRSELKIMNTEQYIQTMTWLQTLTGLLEQMQVWNFFLSYLLFKPEVSPLVRVTVGIFCLIVVIKYEA